MTEQLVQQEQNPVAGVVSKTPVSAGLLVDFGNSGTRVSLVLGNRIFRFDMSNEFMEMPRDYKIPAIYRKRGAELFAYNGQYFFHGDIVQREFGAKKMRPSAAEGDKPDQLTTALTLNLAFIKAVELIQMAAAKPASALDITFRVGVLLPPMQLDNSADKMLRILSGFNSVHRYLPFEAHYSFKVHPEPIIEGEGIAGFFGAVYTSTDKRLLPESQGKSVENGDVLVYEISENFTPQAVPENAKFETGYTLVIDIGAGTTDVVVILDGVIVDNSRATFKYGGNTAKSTLQTEIRKRYGFTPTDIDKVVQTGVLEEGEYLHDVSDLVTVAKKDYADRMIVELRTYLEGLSGLEPKNLKGLLVMGGGSMPTLAYVVNTTETRVVDGNTTEVPVRKLYPTAESAPEGASKEIVSPAMSTILHEYLKNLAPHMLEVKVPLGSQRTLNIDGLEIIYRGETQLG
jgi:hypothetical protein